MNVSDALNSLGVTTAITPLCGELFVIELMGVGVSVNSYWVWNNVNYEL